INPVGRYDYRYPKQFSHKSHGPRGKGKMGMDDIKAFPP
ncbi:unnamed protein product, partial [marine sediment metagenome]